MSKFLITLALLLMPLHAAEPTPAELLRSGLFEEEVNRNLDKAAEHYRAIIAAHDRDRALAASATFRLGEIARKNNDSTAAAAAFRSVTERFPEQAELVKLSVQNLTALGIATSAPNAPATTITDPEVIEIARLKELARNSPDLVDGPDQDGMRPIHHAAAKGWAKVIEYLLANGADPNSLTSKFPITALHIAAGRGHLAVVKALLASKADPNLTVNSENCGAVQFPPRNEIAMDAKGRWTALDMALIYNRKEISTALIEAGTDFLRKAPLLAQGHDPTNSLQLAMILKHNALAENMIQLAKPAALSARGDLTRTLLATAVSRNPALVIPLLNAGVDVKETSKNGSTALHFASDPEIAELLITKGADPKAKDSAGLTPLDYIVQSQNVAKSIQVMDTLIKHGATVGDPMALHRLTSNAMLPHVRERFVYPKVHNPAAILFAAGGHQGSHNRNGTPPEIITVENRLSEASSPPSLMEALCIFFYTNDSRGLQSMSIKRRNADNRFQTVREWNLSDSDRQFIPQDMPKLEWGDIIEVYLRNSNQTTLDLTASIPSRTVTIRIGELSFPKIISGQGTFWLVGNQALKLDYKFIGNLVFLDRCVIHRKGIAEPIPLRFNDVDYKPFRLLDGDTIELELNHASIEKECSDGMIWEFALLPLEEEGCGGSNLYSPMVNFQNHARMDFSKIAILRGSKNYKMELWDSKAWLDELPPEEKWTKDTFASLPKFHQGDVVILVEDPKFDPTAHRAIKSKLKAADQAGYR